MNDLIQYGIFGMLPVFDMGDVHRYRKPKSEGWEPGHCKARTITACDIRARKKRVVKRRQAKGYGV